MRHGYLLIHKPIGPTSHDIVAMARKALHERSIGHLGTLDPAAEGLMVLAIGKKALKTIELFEKADKTYEAGVEFGTMSTTYDREGTLEVVPPKAGFTVPEFADVNRTIQNHFVGAIDQVPPAYSALKVGGERAYRKIRQGRSVDLPARPVHIHECSIMEYNYPHLTLRVHCGSGTYIRSLAHDLGQRLHCGGYLSSLKRTKVGHWQLEDARSPDSIRFSDVLPLKDVLKHSTSYQLVEEEYANIQHGRPVEATVETNTIAWYNDLPVAILSPKKDNEALAHPRKVL